MPLSTGASSTWRRDVGRWLVWGVVIALAAWRLAFVLAGPDPDSDAYGHHAIARQILVVPGDLTIHWVWLPLFHYVQAIAVALGATLDSVRLANVAVSAAVPMMLYAALREHRARPRTREGGGRPTSIATAWDPAPALAAIVCALSPIAMQMGTTGQTEPVFQLLAIVIAFAFGCGRLRLASAALTVAVLVRYEAWAVVPAVALAAIAEAAWWRRVADARAMSRSVRSLWVAVPPIVAILAWAAIRRPQDGAWFWFLTHTRSFANEALRARSSLDRGVEQLVTDLIYYAVHVPWRVVGYPLLLAPFGVVRTVRREGARFCAIYLSILGFITLAWVLRSSLGLERHFVVLVPFYATLIANGIVAIGDGVARILDAPFRRFANAFAGAGAARAAVIAGLACAVFARTGVSLVHWMNDWTHASRDVWPERRLVAAFLRSLPADALVFCDEPTIEVLSGLDRRRVDRHAVDDADGLGRVAAAARQGSRVYVATFEAHAARVVPLGEVVFRVPEAGHPGERLLVVRVDGARVSPG